ncbi:MAG: DUF4231 domain-containing protein [Candidatus Competibacteraceae bacterium]
MTATTSMTPQQSDSLKYAWDLQSKWSQAADRLKRQVQSARLLAAVLGLLGAILAALAGVLGEGTLQTSITWLGAACLAVAPVILKSRVAPEQVRAWTLARAASEKFKREVYGFLAGGPPYGIERSPKMLVENCQKVLDNEDIKRVIPAITDIQPENRPVPELLTVADYSKQRLEGQAAWYNRKAARFGRLAHRFDNIIFGLGLIGAVLSARMALGGGWAPLISPWVPVITTVIAGIAAYAAAERYATLAITYSAIATKLENLKVQFSIDPNRDTPERIEQFVSDCEEALSAENGGWVAEWSHEPDRSQT